MSSDTETASVYDRPEQESHQEISKVVINLQIVADQLAKNTERIIDKTSSVAAMDRSIPPEEDNPLEREIETELGRELDNLAGYLRDINDRLNTHCFRLEIG
jgi:hypothetical protein